MYRVPNLTLFAFRVLKFPDSVTLQGQRRHFICSEGRPESLVSTKSMFILHVN